MGDINELINIDVVSVCLSLFLIAFGVKQVIEIIMYFKNKFKIRTVIGENKELEENRLKSIEDRIETLERHDKWQYEEITKISKGVSDINKSLSDMRKEIDETEMAKLKDSIVTYYKKYKELGEWTELESEAFWDLFARYEAHGGNGYVHSVIEPVMRELKEI